MSSRKDIFQKLPLTFTIKQFGSSVFGGADKNSDIDLLLVSFNELLNREDFFSDFLEHLKQDKEITDVQAIPKAMVPIIKMVFKGIQLDILYCAMQTPSQFILQEWLSTETKLELTKEKIDAYFSDISNTSFDKANNNSFLGWKNCSIMLSMIENKDTFSVALRIIKTWARRRGIYGFNFGYLNGISLVIMLIKAQQYLKEDSTSKIEGKGKELKPCSK